MGEYMRTLLNGLKVWVTGEVGKLRAKIEAVATAASKTARLAAKNKKDIALLNEDMDGAYAKANAAQTAADNAQTAADNAQTAADNAQTAADNAQTAADNAQTAADEIKETAYRRQITWDLDCSGVDSVVWNGFHFYKVTDDVYNSHQVFTSRFTLFHTSIGKRVSQMVKGFVSSNGKAAIYQSDNIAGIFVSDYVGTLNIEGIAVNIPSKGTYFMNDGGNSVSYYVKEMFINRCVGLNVYSSTTDSTKRFKITVDDTGTLTTTEVTS